MVSIVAACTGNVCRSPLVERLLQRSLDDAYGPRVTQVRSVDTGALVDTAMDEQSARILTDLGGDHAGFISWWLEPEMVSEADLVLTATRDHRHAAMQPAPRAMRRTFTVRELPHLVADLDPTELDVVDPDRQTEGTYQIMRAQLVSALDAISRVVAP